MSGLEIRIRDKWRGVEEVAIVGYESKVEGYRRVSRREVLYISFFFFCFLKVRERDDRKRWGVKFISLMEEGISRLTMPPTKQPSSTLAEASSPSLTLSPSTIFLPCSRVATFTRPIFKTLANLSKTELR